MLGNLKENAFTLVELLMVITIISILAALLLPALEKGLEMSRRSACQGNLHQMYLAAVQRADDQGGLLPWFRGQDSGYVSIDCKYGKPNSASGGYDEKGQLVKPLSAGTGWYVFVAEKYMTQALFACPSNRNALNLTANNNSGYSGIHYSYRHNGLRTMMVNSQLITRNEQLYLTPPLDTSNPNTWSTIDSRLKTWVFQKQDWLKKPIFVDYGAGNNSSALYVPGEWPHREGGNAALHNGAIKWFISSEPLQNAYGGTDYGTIDPRILKAK